MNKAYLLGLRNDDDAGNELVFAQTAREARKQIYSTDLDPENWIDVTAHRAKKWDHLFGSSRKEQYKAFWRDGWWFHQSGCPDVDEATDEQFYEWYDNTYGVNND